MAVIERLSTEHCASIIITDKAYAHLTEEEIEQRRIKMRRNINRILKPHGWRLVEDDERVDSGYKVQ